MLPGDFFLFSSFIFHPFACTWRNDASTQLRIRQQAQRNPVMLRVKGKTEDTHTHSVGMVMMIIQDFLCP